MTLPELVRRSAEKLLDEYCDRSTPSCPLAGPRIFYRFGGDAVTIFSEQRSCGEAASRAATAVAQFRYSRELRQWTLHYADQHQRWHFYLNAAPTLDPGKLLKHLDDDPLHVFWG